MRRLRFPEFTHLPRDLQLVIFDHALDKRDPFGFNVPDRKDYYLKKRKQALQQWIQLRLVCREWSEWFSINAIRYFISRWDKLSYNQLLEGMTSLTYLEICSPPYSKELKPEAVKRLASMVPSSVRHLTSCAVGLLLSLSRENSCALQTIIVSCEASEPRIIQSVKSLFGKFGQRIKHLKVVFNYDSLDPPLINAWNEALTDCPMEELTLEPERNRTGILPELPRNLKRLNVVNFFAILHIDAGWLPPVANSLEMLNAPFATLRIHRGMPVMPALKEIRISEVCPLGDEDSYRFSNDETLLSSYWPNLEKFQLNRPGNFLLPQGISKMTTLNTVRIVGQYPYTNGVDLSELPPSLEEFMYTSDESGKIEGQPQQEMKYLRKLDLRLNNIDLSKGVFNFMPALQELKLNGNRNSRYDGIKLEELLPLRDTLIDADVQVHTRSRSSQDVLNQFSCLKRLAMSYIGRMPFELGRFPHSLEALSVKGNFIIDLPLESLSNLRELDITISSDVSAQLMINIMQIAPNLRSAHLRFVSEEQIKDFFSGMKDKIFERITQLIFSAELKPLADKIIRLLEIFPNIVSLHIFRNDKIDKTNLPVKLLSFLKSNPSVGTQLETVAIDRGLKFEELNEDSKVAFKDLQDIGVQLVKNA